MELILKLNWLSLIVFLLIFFLIKPLRTKNKITLNIAFGSGIVSMLYYAIGLIFLFQKTNNNLELANYYSFIGMISFIISSFMFYLLLATVIYLTYYSWFFKNYEIKIYFYLLGINLVLCLILIGFINWIIISNQTFTANNVVGLVSFLLIIPLYFLNYFYLFYLISYLSNGTIFKWYIFIVNKIIILSSRYIVFCMSCSKILFPNNKIKKRALLKVKKD